MQVARAFADRVRSRTVQTAIVCGIAAAALAPEAAAVTPQIAAKQAEAQQVLAEVQSLDARLEKAVEAFNLANIQLGRIGRDLRQNTHDLGIARGNLRFVQRSLEQRLVTLYTAGDPQTGLAVLLGAQSLNDALDQLDASQRISSQDATLIRQVRSFRSDVAARQQLLGRDLRTQSRLVNRRAATKAWIQSQLGLRQRLLASIKGQLAQLEAQQRAEEARLRRLALERLAAQQAAERAAAAKAKRSLLLSAQPQPDQAAASGQPAGTDPATAPLSPSPPPPDRYADVVPIAMRYLGVPYVWGGASPSGFDCSGFTMYVYAQVGVTLPHYAAAQYQMGSPVPYDQLQPGDLVFFDGLGHVALYIGGGMMIQAPETGDVVKVTSMSDPWVQANYVGARRL